MNGHYPNPAEPALAWAEDAACRGRDVSEFFTKNQRRVQEIKNLCERCPVREKCLDEALRAEDTSRYGIYGGLTAEERARLGRRR
ncbi:WhiB family redox-sensing transcriptional regulator [Streptomyces sp. Ag109_O5-1]|uniref:WhiB family transcriptional regulator n=1 Tax=Streptomyces sp. Ag109_O5-1 TaxID=1938851 RepID=UPI000FC32D75|nr:WhiB family transcriptional regulator [Streptomyces sp. Ag109_O5-1]RPE40225.1 WhiB family redox-sensing transcriptional regulator [Streptomyces sp. Ag109_O5-1]